ncbi:MAG: hypothetical protein ACOYNY_22075 [Caldilineaceae bacterium]
MTHYIQRTVTTTIIETLTLFWCYTNHDDPTPALDTLTAATPLLVYSISRVTSTVNKTILPVCLEEGQIET